MRLRGGLLLLMTLCCTLTVGAGVACTTGESERIVFISARDPGLHIYIMGHDGSDQRPLTTGNTDHHTPSLSHDGSRIAFSRLQRSQNPDSDIYVMASDGTDGTQLTSDKAQEGFPTWSPDDQRIAFQAGTQRVPPMPTDRTARLYVIDADGSARAKLTGNDAGETTPNWSPDGTRIAFSSNLFGNWDIQVVGIDGAEQKRLTSSPAEDIFPAWSPDGSRIAFVSNRGGSHEIYVMRLDGSEPEPVTTDAKLNQFSGLSWSPDGLSIAFVSSRTGNSDIFSISLVNGKETPLTWNERPDLSPSWGPVRSRGAPHVRVNDAIQQDVAVSAVDSRFRGHDGAAIVEVLVGVGP